MHTVQLVAAALILEKLEAVEKDKLNRVGPDEICKILRSCPLSVVLLAAGRYTTDWQAIDKIEEDEDPTENLN